MSKIISHHHNRISRVIILCLITLIVASCAYQPEPSANDLPGFFYGLLHGFLIFFSFIGGFFADVRIYAFPNSGGWYDFGYLLGIGTALGASVTSTR